MPEVASQSSAVTATLGRIASAFQDRSGRVIALGRAGLAFFFLLVLWADVTQPAIHEGAIDLLLWSYCGLAVTYLVATWNRWWLEARLALPFHFVDLLVFSGLNYATKGYESPFFLFSTFLLLSASLRWGPRETLATVAGLILLYVIEGISASTWGTAGFDLERFGLRSAYLLVLAAMLLLWFASRTGRSAAAIAPELAPVTAEESLRAALAAAVDRLGARTAVASWSEEEEPWRFVLRLRGADFEKEALEPDAFDPLVAPALGDSVMIFDGVRGEVLRGSSRARPERIAEPVNSAFAACYGLESGIRIPLRTGAVEGEIFVGGIEGLCPDDLDVAAALHEGIAVFLERAELARATAQSALMRARLSFARDVHDGVVQFLAGTAMRLEGLKRGLAADEGARADIEALQAELVGEQQDLRGLIRRLQAGALPAGRVDTASTLAGLAERLGRQWELDCRLSAPQQPVLIDGALDAEVQSLVREAVANAARHGRAKSVAVRLAAEPDALLLDISDDGAGFAQCGRFAHAELAASPVAPRSIFDRVQQRGGTLGLESGPNGARLVIRLPLEGDAE